jgi:hypothetical protein
MAGFLRFALPLLALLSIFPLYTRYKAAAAPIPPGVHLASLELSHLKDPAEIEAVMAAGLGQPIAVYYDDTRLVLRPEEVDFAVDTAAMLAEAQQYLDGPDFVDIALRKLAGIPQQRRDIAARYSYDAQKLATWLWRAGEELNHPPQPGRVLPPQWNWRTEGGMREAGEEEGGESGSLTAYATLPATFVGAAQRSWQWTSGTVGQTLLIDESAQSILDALGSMDARTAHLALQESPPPPLSMAELGRELNAYTSDFPGFAAIYVQDLTTGEEATVDVDVAFSGMSTLKIAIVSEVFRQMADFENEAVGQWIDYALGESNNAAANRLLQWVGDGDIYAGGRRVTEMMRALGFTNSYIQTGYDDKSIIGQIPTPANSRTDWNTNPDTHLQSTPAELGRLLAEIYRCQAGEGLLLETFGGDITPEECRTILFYMSHNEFMELVWGGLPRPAQSWVVHKHGFVNEAHSDLLLVWGPSGPYVIAVYLWRAGWMDWQTSDRAMKEISRIVWNFFAYKSAREGIEAPPPLLLSPPPNYVPVNSYRSRAAVGG